MTDKYDHDPQSTGEVEDANEQTADPMDTAVAVVSDSARDGRLAVLGGGALLLSTLRSIARGQLRAIPKAAVGAGLLGIGLRQRQSDDASTFEPSLDEIDGETDDKTASDDAHAIRENAGPGEETLEGDADDEGSRIEFTDDADDSEPRSKPDIDADEEDPRRNDDDDGSVEIDVSEPAMADEAGEATGPDPEQAQPAQTDSTEPEASPDVEEDASDMQVEPDDDADAESDEATDDEGESEDEDGT